MAGTETGAGPAGGPHVALCVASRGTGHMPTIFGAWLELLAAGVPYTLCPTFYKPIPEAQNRVTALGLASPADVLWYVEDDQLLPAGVLAAMLDAYRAGHPIVTVDYRTRAGGPMVGYHPKTGRAVMTPMGCLLVAREVFAAISDPPFQAVTAWDLRDGAFVETDRIAVAGYQDVWFSRELIRAGYAIHVLDGWEVGHLDCTRHGGRVNYGTDEVRLIGGKGDLRWRPPEVTRARRRAQMARARADGADATPPAPGEEDVAMAYRYFRSPHGTVIDLEESAVPRFLKRSPATWTEISKAQFEKALALQQAHRAKRREEQLAELKEDD